MDYKVAITEDMDIERLRKLWEPLELIAKPSYFLSWSWIETWLLTYKPRFIAVCAIHGGRTVAIGLFTRSSKMRHKIVSARQLRLHQTGNKDMDQIWVEYNDFLADPAHKMEVVNQCLNHIEHYYSDWDELVISMTLAHHENEYKIRNTAPLILDQKPTYSVNLAKLRNENSSYLEYLSANTRHQIRKSYREYIRLYGDITIQFAQSVEEALEIFEIGGEAHKSRWSDSGYKNEHFVTFHKALIRNNFIKNQIDVIKVQAGDTTVGISYNFLNNNTVYFYLNGLFYVSNNKIRPGYVLHSVIIQQYLDRGFDYYDFMGGYSRYKESLATHSKNLVTICYQRNKLIFAMENMARRIKSKDLNG